MADPATTGGRAGGTGPLDTAGSRLRAWWRAAVREARTERGRAVGASWLAARAGVLAAWILAAAAARRLTPGSDPFALTQGLWAWDGGWYVGIADTGYAGQPAEAVRFFPLYPFVARLVSPLFAGRVDIALVVVANVAALGAAVLLARLAAREGGAADPGLGARTAWLLALAPPAFVLVWAYAEALYLVLAVAAFTALRTRRWGWAALAAAGAATCRPIGLALLVPAAWEVWRAGRLRGSDRNQRILDGVARAAAVLGPVAGLLVVLGVAAAHGDALAPLRLQEGFRGEFVDPVRRLWQAGVDLAGAEALGDGLHLPFALAGVVLVVVAFRRLPAAYGLYALAVLVVALAAENLNSLERYMLNAFPLVVALAAWARSPAAERFALAVSASGFVALAGLAFLGAYVP